MMTRRLGGFWVYMKILPVVAVMCMPSVRACAGDRELFWGSSKTEHGGYPILNLAIDSIYAPRYERLVAALPKTNISPDNPIFKSGIVIFDRNQSVDGTGSFLMNIENDSGGSVPLGSIAVPNLTGTVYWVKILAKGAGVEKPVSIRVVKDNKSPDDTGEGQGQLFAGASQFDNQRDFDWSYYVYEIYNKSCFHNNPMKNVDISFNFSGKGKIWIDRIEVIDTGITEEDFFTAMPRCGEDGKHDP